MSLWDKFKRALGEQARSLRTSWTEANITEPGSEHIPENERPFFERRYADFIERAKHGEALITVHSRDEMDLSGIKGRAAMLNFGTQLPEGKVTSSVEKNESFLQEFRKFLRSFDFNTPAIEQALKYATHLSQEGMETRRKEHAERRAYFNASLAPQADTFS